tara:strand:+ start:133 stop:339 length:207 start_codon:yes stop_codon:yes gene_type:complete
MYACRDELKGLAELIASKKAQLPLSQTFLQGGDKKEEERRRRRRVPAHVQTNTRALCSFPPFLPFFLL